MALRPINDTLRHRNTDYFNLAIPKTPTPVSCMLPGKQEGFGAFQLQPEVRPVKAQPAQRCPHCTTFPGKPGTLLTTISFQAGIKPLTPSRLPSLFPIFQQKSSCAIPANSLLKSGKRSHKSLMRPNPCFITHTTTKILNFIRIQIFFFYHWHIKALENGLNS